MKSWEVEQMAREEGYDEGKIDGQEDMQARINQLNIFLAEAGRTEDIVKSARDKVYQENLFEEFGLK
ncbi:MAG: hypothetical protein J6B68_05965 [Lachnospiraceae bacterium]|nr:hypothetical protein [Lachnospiraceae bacterium]